MAILLTSFFISRQFLGPVFRKLHFVLAGTVLAASLWHVMVLRESVAKGPIILAASVWVATRIWIMARLYFFGVGATVEAVAGPWNAGRLRCERPVRIFPGCYFYIFPPENLHLSGYRMVPKWYSSSRWPGSIDLAESIEFFIANGRNRPPPLQTGHRWLIDGPYGNNPGLGSFENVMLAAKGVGVVGVLSFALNLLERQRHDLKMIKSSAEQSNSEKSNGHQESINEKSGETSGQVSSDEKSNSQNSINERSGGRPGKESNGERTTGRKSIDHKLFRDMTKRVDILWKLDYNSQDQLVAQHLRELQSKDDYARLSAHNCVFFANCL